MSRGRSVNVDFLAEDERRRVGLLRCFPVHLFLLQSLTSFPLTFRHLWRIGRRCVSLSLGRGLVSHHGTSMFAIVLVLVLVVLAIGRQVAQHPFPTFGQRRATGDPMQRVPGD